MPPTRFFSFDGLDGVGKTTQMDLFCQWLTELGHQVVTCRDPGSTSLGEQIRKILLASDDMTPISGRSEMLLYMAARAQLVEEVIRPALEAGKTLVSDRYLLANVVYQGHAGGLEVPMIREVGQVATAGVMPDCTFLLDMPPHQAWQRMGRQLDRIESRGLEYRERLRDGFLAEARQTDPQQTQSIHVVDAARPIGVIQQELREIAMRVL
jgi:dTMP kinase